VRYTADAERRVRLAAHRDAGSVGLVGTEVERAQGHRAAAHAQHQVAVGEELRFLVRGLAALQEKELGAIQTDAGRAHRECLGDIVAGFGIRLQADVDAVAAARGRTFQARQRALLALVFAALAVVARQIARIRLDHDFAGGRVDQQRIAIVHLRQRLVGADDQRQVQAAREDGAVRQRAALRGHHGHHAAFDQLGKFGRRHRIGDQHFAGDAGNCVCAIGASMQGCVDAADHVVEVFAAAAQVRVVDAVEDRCQPVALQLQRVVGAVAAGADEVVQAEQQFGVIEDQRMQVEELAQLMGDRPMQPLAHAQQLGPRHVQRLVQPFDLDFDRTLGNVLCTDFKLLRLTQARPAQRLAT
jgi:hypothetical protein